MAAYNLIATTTVGSGGASTIVFSSIPQIYTDLKVVVSLRSSTSGNQILISLNGSTSSFANLYLSGDGTSAASGTLARYSGVSTYTSETASVFSNGEIYFPNYTGSTNKSFSSDTTGENNGTTTYSVFVAGLWSNTAAITSLTMANNTGSWVQYSSASLYGIKNS
jgi:hypothetical protein